MYSLFFTGESQSHAGLEQHEGKKIFTFARIFKWVIWLSWKQHTIVCVYTHIAFIILSGEDYNICFHLEIPPTVPTMMAKVWTTYIVDTIQTDDLLIQRKLCLFENVKMQKCLCDGMEYSASIKVIMSVLCVCVWEGEKFVLWTDGWSVWNLNLLIRCRISSLMFTHPLPFPAERGSDTICQSQRRTVSMFSVNHDLPELKSRNVLHPIHIYILLKQKQSKD